MKCSASLKIEIKLILSDIKSNICSLFKKKNKIQETIKMVKSPSMLQLSDYEHIHVFLSTDSST